MRKILSFAAGLLLSSQALAQQGVPYFPQTIPSGTVIGRLSSGAGPTEAISTTSLLNALFPVGSAAFPFNAASVVYQGSVSGTVTTQAQAVAGNWTLLWPTTVGATNSCLIETVSGSVATASWTPCARLGANNTFTGNNTFNGSSTFAGLSNFQSSFQISGVSQVFPASGNLVGTTDNQTLTNKHIDATEIDTGTLSYARLPGGINANQLLSKTANYTIASGDCGYTVNASGGPFTLTLPAVAGFSAQCVVQVCNINANDNTHHAIRLSGWPSPSLGRLWMGQCQEASIVNGVWVVTKFAGKFRPGFVPTLYVDTSNGSDSNDGLISNASGNALLTVQKCWDIFQNEMALGTNQATCSPTGGQTFNGGLSCSSAGQPNVYNLYGNGGTAIIRNTGGSVVVQENDFCGYIIFDSVNLDCTSAASHPCTGLFVHQQNGVDLSTSGHTTGVTFTGANAGDVAVSCDAMCRINSAAAVTFAGTMANGFVVDQTSSLNIQSGITIAASATISGSIFKVSGGSQIAYSGTIAYGAGSAVGETFTGRGNGSYVCVGSIATSGVASGRQWSILNGAALMNLSGTAVPGSAGIAAAGTFGNGTIFAATGGGGC